MQLLNATKMQAGYTLGLDPDGRERLVVVIKGTFYIPESPTEAPLADEQVPLVMADTFTGEPGLSATLAESDFAPVKPRCDVLLNGSAYAPEGKAAPRVSVGLRVGQMTKIFDVVGDRCWTQGLLGMSPSAPVPFVTKTISYDCAFGGVDVDVDDPQKCKAYQENPVGVGYYPLSKSKALEGKSLPNTEETDRPVTSVKGKYRPMAFGAIGRNFKSRIPLAGTYDQHWLDNVFPFLPADFDPCYFQAAPANQQIDYPQGGEQVVLLHLMPEAQRLFTLPKITVPVEFTTATLERTEKMAVLDTILIEPDAKRLLLTWRASQLLKRNILEMAQVVVGRMPKGWYRARETGKTYYPSLAYLTHARSAVNEKGRP